VAAALANSQFVNFGTSGGAGGDHGAVTTGSDDILRVVQTLMAAQVITGGLRVNSEVAAAPAPPAAPSSPPFPSPARPRGT
jgi:hypothetical protein